MSTSHRQSKGNTGSNRRASEGVARRRLPASTSSTGKGSTGTYSSLGSTGSMTAAKEDRHRVRSDGNRAAAKRRPSKRRGHGAHMAAHAAPRKKRGMPAWGVFLLVFLVIGIGVGGLFFANHLLHPYEGARVEDGQTVTVVIPEGSSGSTIIDVLLDAGVIHSSKDFRKALKQQNADQNMKSGTYTFVTGSDPSDVVRQLVAGANTGEGRLVVPEGLTLDQTASLVEQSLGIKRDDFVAQAKAGNYVSDYPFLSNASNDSLEGFLYPKTYDFAGKDITADTVIRMMLTQFETEVESLDMESAQAAISARYNLAATNYDMLKIASIIEKEAINEDDRPKVSSVFYNRLSTNMALQSDATMGYETGGNVTSEDLAVDSPYNTYLYKGLPPTPICSPSLWAIEAAMAPADTEYLYFFIIEDGVYSNHTFSKTYEEHHSAYVKALEEQAAANENKE